MELKQYKLQESDIVTFYILLKEYFKQKRSLLNFVRRANSLVLFLVNKVKPEKSHTMTQVKRNEILLIFIELYNCVQLHL